MIRAATSQAHPSCVVFYIPAHLPTVLARIMPVYNFVTSFSSLRLPRFKTACVTFIFYVEHNKL